MRVIAGKYRSRKLLAPRGLDVRPTSDRLRETLFNVLAPRIEGAVFIDVYAGTGAVGIEALSRGARQVYFIENGKESVAAIRANLASLEITEGYELIQRDAGQALRLLDSQAVVSDLLFLDPPYRMEGAYAEALGFLSDSRLLRPASIAVAEHDKHFDPGDRFGALVRYRTLKQGDAVLSFYKLATDH